MADVFLSKDDVARCVKDLSTENRQYVLILAEMFKDPQEIWMVTKTDRCFTEGDKRTYLGLYEHPDKSDEGYLLGLAIVFKWSSEKLWRADKFSVLNGYEESVKALLNSQHRQGNRVYCLSS